MPVSLDGVGVWVNSIPCSLFYVSPTQINFLVPYQLTAGTVSLVVARDSQAGPTVTIQLNTTSPGLFLWNGNSAVAGHLNGVALSDTSLRRCRGKSSSFMPKAWGRTSPGYQQRATRHCGFSDLLSFAAGDSAERHALSAWQCSLCGAGSGFRRSLPDQFAAPG